MKKPIPRSGFFDILLIIVGTLLLAFAINLIYDPMSLVTGGFFGIGIILKHLTGGFFENGIPLWLTNIILNIPLFLIGMKVKGVKFIGRTLVGTVFLSIWLYVLPTTSFIKDDILLAVLFGGLISGAGIGLVLKGHGTTGGTDMLSAILAHVFRLSSIPKVLLFVDGLVILAGATLFGVHNALYALIAVFVESRVSDWIIEGINFSKSVLIITDHQEEVAEVIMTGLERGVTGISAKGMYSKGPKNLLFCVVSKAEILELKEYVYQVDPKAFVIVSDARDVLGEGFSEYKKNP